MTLFTDHCFFHSVVQANKQSPQFWAKVIGDLYLLVWRSWISSLSFQMALRIPASSKTFQLPRATVFWAKVIGDLYLLVWRSWFSNGPSYPCKFQDVPTSTRDSLLSESYWWFISLGLTKLNLFSLFSNGPSYPCKFQDVPTSTRDSLICPANETNVTKYLLVKMGRLILTFGLALCFCGMVKNTVQLRHYLDCPLKSILPLRWRESIIVKWILTCCPWKRKLIYR